AAPSLVNPGDPVQPLPRKRRPVAPPDPGREAGEQQQEERGDREAPEGYRGRSRRRIRRCGVRRGDEDEDETAAIRARPGEGSCPPRARGSAPRCRRNPP